MNKENLQKIIDRLFEIKEKVYIDVGDGICANLLCRTYNERCFLILVIPSILDNWLKRQFELWSECYILENGTKEIAYPVAGYKEYKIEQAQGTLWDNPKRLELLDFLISQVEQQIKEIKD